MRRMPETEQRWGKREAVGVAVGAGVGVDVAVTVRKRVVSALRI